jgi:hypothetical protein
MGSSSGDGGSRGSRGQRTNIDAAEYIDFTTVKYNAMTWKREAVLDTLGGRTYRNGNSYIKINAFEGTIELSSDKAFFDNRTNCQFYAKFSLDVLGASTDCLYIRRNIKEGGTIIINNETYKNEQIPDLTVCIPLYGYSGNRIEVSPVMNGFIAMPSGTYWNR